MSVSQVGNIDPRVYTGVLAVTTQSFTEANVKNGVQYYISESFDIPQSTFKYIKFATGAKDTIVKLRIVATSGGLEYLVFRSPTITPATGVPFDIFNLNDIDPKPVEMTISEDPTVTDEGDRWDVVTAFNQQGNQSGGGVFQSSGIERILKPSTDYLVKFTNTDNATIQVQYTVSWYEGPLSSNII